MRPASMATCPRGVMQENSRPAPSPSKMTMAMGVSSLAKAATADREALLPERTGDPRFLMGRYPARRATAVRGHMRATKDQRFTPDRVVARSTPG